MGKMYGKITDWSVDDDGLPLTNSKRRGIITDDYKIEPFFELLQLMAFCFLEKY